MGDPRIGTEFGAYRIESVLGRGGMGVVYLATDRKLGRNVALKLLPEELAEDEAFRQRFVRESHMAASIDHRNIIPIYEAGEIDGIAYLAMRYVKGTDLARRLKEGPLAPQSAVTILAEVAEALDAAHARGLVHRDVKPGNILVADAPGHAEPVYLTDFGLTKQRASQSGLTQAGAFLGTLAYMAPEQVEGRDTDAPADEYSLAAMAYECLTGQVPFIRGSDIGVAMAHLHDPVPSAAALRPDLPIAVDTVLARGMAKDPADRYVTCAAFVSDLRSALGGGAIRARPGTVRSSRTLVVVAFGVGLVVMVAAGAYVASGTSGVFVAPPPSPSPLAIATSTASPVQDPERIALLDRLPASIRPGCIDDPSPPASASIALKCKLPAGSAAVTVWYAKYADLATATRDFEGFASAAQRGIVPVGEEQPCSANDTERGDWSQGGQVQGRVLCYPSGSRSFIVWTWAADSMIGRAVRDDHGHQQLYDWWTSVGNNLGQ